MEKIHNTFNLQIPYFVIFNKNHPAFKMAVLSFEIKF